MQAAGLCCTVRVCWVWVCWVCKAILAAEAKAAKARMCIRQALYPLWTFHTCCITALAQLGGGGLSGVSDPKAARVADSWWGVKDGSRGSEQA